MKIKFTKKERIDTENGVNIIAKIRIYITIDKEWMKKYFNISSDRS